MIASEARQISTQSRLDATAATLKDVHAKIFEAATSGECSVYHDFGGKGTSHVVKKSIDDQLRNAGYTTKKADQDQRDPGPIQWLISW